jgi:hypothetical protein
MQQRNPVRSVIFGMTALALSACGGGGNSSSSTSTPDTSGKAVDGYISGAKVTLDINDDRICGAAEPSVYTDTSGNYSFPGQGQHMVCVNGGTDLATNQPLIGTLLAPPGATQATPLTTLVMAQLNIAKGAPVAGMGTPVLVSDAAAQATLVADKLGLGSTDILNKDPVAVGGTLATTTAAVQALMVKTARTIQAAAGGGISTTGNTTVLYADAASATATALTLQFTPLDTSTLGNIANTVVTATLASAKTDSAVTGLSKLADIDPISLAAFAAPTIKAMTNAIAGATPDIISTPSAGNPAESVATDVALSNTVADVTDTLLTLLAGTSASTIALDNIASTALSTNSNGVTTAAPGSTIVASIHGNLSFMYVSAPGDTLLTIELNGANGQPVVLPTHGIARSLYPLSGFKAVIDVNDDHVCEADEPATTTDIHGLYAFDPAFGTSHMVCVSSGTDPVSYQSFTGTQLAPAGATEANVLTTLVVAQQLNHPGTSASAAAATIAAGLGLPAGTKLLTTDPYAPDFALPTWDLSIMQTQVLMTELTGVIMAAAGDYPTPGDAHSGEAYLDIAKVAASNIAANSSPGAGQNIASIALGALLAAKADTLLSTPAMAGFSPDKVISFVGNKLQQDNATLASIPYTTYDILSAANNIVKSPVLNNLVAALCPVLLATDSAVPTSPLQISAVANDVFGGLSSDKTALTQKVIGDLQDIGLTLTAPQQQVVTGALEGDPANMGFVHGIVFAANGLAVSGTINGSSAPQATADIFGPLSEILLSVAPDGTAVSAYQPGSLTLSVARHSYYYSQTTDKRALTLTLDNVTYQQTAAYGVLSATFPTNSAHLLRLTGTNADGSTVNATLSGSQAATVVNFNSGTLALNLAGLQAELQAANAPGFGALDALTGGNSHGESFDIDLSFQGLRLAQFSITSNVITSFNSVVEVH